MPGLPTNQYLEELLRLLLAGEMEGVVRSSPGTPVVLLEFRSARFGGIPADLVVEPSTTLKALG